MKIYTSYFYQIRNMNKYIIPLSTAVWDPSWYHEGNGKSYAYKDKNGTYVGLRAEPFVPNKSCQDLCRGPENCFSKDPNDCDFLKRYRMQLNAYDFNTILGDLYGLAEMIKDQDNLDRIPDIALIFHEAPDNPCSERHVVTSWFKGHGYDIEEFNKD